MAAAAGRRTSAATYIYYTLRTLDLMSSRPYGGNIYLVWMILRTLPCPPVFLDQFEMNTARKYGRSVWDDHRPAVSELCAQQVMYHRACLVFVFLFIYFRSRVRNLSTCGVGGIYISRMR